MVLNPINQYITLQKRKQPPYFSTNLLEKNKNSFFKSTNIKFYHESYIENIGYESHPWKIQI